MHWEQNQFTKLKNWQKISPISKFSVYFYCLQLCFCLAKVIFFLNKKYTGWFKTAMQNKLLNWKLLSEFPVGNSALNRGLHTPTIGSLVLARLHLSFIPGASLISRRDARLMDFHRAERRRWSACLLSRHFWVYFLSASIISRRWCVLKSNFPSPIYMQTNSLAHIYTYMRALSPPACERASVWYRQRAADR